MGFLFSQCTKIKRKDYLKPKKMKFTHKTVFISGATRGIGKAIGLRLAAEGANIVVTGKTDSPHPKLPGTIHSAAKEMEDAGGQALAVAMDIRSEEQVVAAIHKTVETFGGIDMLINNASAIFLADTPNTPMKRFDLMMQVNVRGTLLLTQQCLPHLKQSDHAHILTLSPPHPLDDKWLGQFLPYTLSKYGMSLCTAGWAREFEGAIGVNSLWPVTTIATAAIKNVVGGEEMMKQSRTPEILADAAYEILRRKPSDCNGNFFTDEEVLKEAGISDFSKYAVNPGGDLMPDLFL
jgi:citronellol/citronellal dehydrogenase